MKKILIAALLALALECQAAPDLPGDIDAITRELAEISGFRQLKKISHQRISRAEVGRMLEERVKEHIKPEELRAEELALKKFGFVPPDFDLKKMTLELLSEQAAAFYDFRKKTLYLVETGSELAERSALVHELAHALADQHFNLERFIEHAKQDDDRSLARLAVMEGQATWLMSEYLAHRTGQSLKDSPALVQMMARMTESGAAQFPVFERSPLYMRETLLFPYSKGMLFQHAVFEKLGSAAFTEVFRRPPESSQQILHPEKYLAGVKPVSCVPPALAARRNYRTLAEGSIGELDHSILLRQYATPEDAEAVAPAWRGGNYQLLEEKGGARIALSYCVQWETPRMAERFFTLYPRVLEGKWKRFEAASAQDSRLAGLGDDGHFVVRLEGARVTSVEGVEAPDSAAVALHWEYPGGVLNRRFATLMLSLGISLPLLTGAEVPRPAPEFVLKLHDGKQLLLSSFRGKVVALEFLLTTCPHCKTCSSLMNNLYRELGPKGFQPLGVAFNPMSGLFVADYVRELKLDFPVGVAEREPVLNFLQHSPLERMLVPQIVFIDRNGVIRAQYSADHDFFKDEEKNMRAQVEALLKEPANRRNPARTKKPASSQAQPAVQ
jgi:peroxiredoxin